MKNLKLFSLGIIFPVFLQGILSYPVLDMHMKRMMSNVHNITQVCELLDLEIDECEKELGIISSTEAVNETDGKVLVAGTEADDIEYAVFDACNPRLMTVELPHHPESDFVVFPACTLVLRCGGCTTSQVLSCEPTEIKEKSLRVFDAQLPFPGAHRFDFKGVRTVTVLEHLKCAPGCRTKVEDCNKLQWYDEDQCSCVCADEWLKSKDLCTEDEMWDDTVCACVCRNLDTHNCQEPAYFHEETCKCTLKTSVSGDIDMDKLIEQIKEGLIDTDYLLKGTEKNSTTKKSGGSQTVVGSVKIDTVTGHINETKEAQNVTEHINETKEGFEKGKSIWSRLSGRSSTTTSSTTTTTTQPTTSTTTSSTTSTTTTTTTAKENPCGHVVCVGSWLGKLKDDNVTCICQPRLR